MINNYNPNRVTMFSRIRNLFTRRVSANAVPAPHVFDAPEWDSTHHGFIEAYNKVNPFDPFAPPTK